MKDKDFFRRLKQNKIKKQVEKKVGEQIETVKHKMDEEILMFLRFSELTKKFPYKPMSVLLT